MTCKPRQISGNDPLGAISKDYNRYCDRIVGNAGDIFITYLLRSGFSDALDQVFTNGQVLDTLTEGIIDGTLTVFGIDAEIVSGKLNFTSMAFSSDGVIDTVNGQVSASSIGRAVSASYNWVNADSTNKMVGWNSSNSSVATSGISGTMYVDASGFLFFFDGANHVIDSGFSDQEFKLIVIIGVNGFHLFVKGTVEYQNCKYIGEWGNVDLTVYGIITGGGINTDFDSMSIPDFLYIDQITPKLILTNEIQQSLFSDSVIDGAFTTPSSGVDPLEIRFRILDLNNYWMVKITPGTVGADTELIKVVASVPSVLATADVDYVASTEYRARLIFDGSDFFKFHIGDSEKLSYFISDTFNEDESDVKLTLNAFTNVSLNGSKRSGYSFKGIT